MRSFFQQRMTIHLFNPENDLALASGSDRYTPPKNALKLATAGALLPVWYGAAGDRVLADQGPINREWLEKVSREFGLEVEAVEKAEPGMKCSPWGWSAASRRKFIDAGADMEGVPSKEKIETLRQLSHRRTSVSILKELHSEGLFSGELPTEARSREEIMEYSLSHPGGFYMKSPWSSTGRGVIASAGIAESEIGRRGEGIVRHQGSVMLEPALDRIRDFAMLFTAGDEGCRFAGFSLFNNETNAYSGNRLLSDNEIREEIATAGGPAAYLDSLKEKLPAIMDRIVGKNYEGYFGIDMMVYRDIDGSTGIAPCIELNLRMTMGVVAHTLREKILAEGVRGTFTIEYRGKSSGAGRSVESHRLAGGELDLVCPNSDFRFVVKTD